MEGLSIAGLILVCFGLNFVWAKNDPVYFGAGKSLTLRPPEGTATATITDIVWRHNGNFAAEWSNTDPDNIVLYRNFKDRTALNTITGVLEIRNMTDKEAGAYTVEINNDLKPDGYEAKLIEEVPEPKVWPRPGKAEGQWELTCEGNTDKAGPVTFWWDVQEDGEWVQSDRKLTIKNNETTQKVEFFFCKMVNPIGEKESGPEINPFYKGENNPALAPLVVVLVLLLIAGLGGVGYWKRDTILQWFGKSGEANANSNVAPKKDADDTDTAKPLAVNPEGGR